MRQISPESNPGHVDDNDVFHHWTIDVSVERYVKVTV